MSTVANNSRKLISPTSQSVLADLSGPFRFGSSIRSARQAAGLNLADLAARARISPHAVWEIETRGGGRMDSIAAVMRALDIRLAGLPRAGSMGEQLRVLRERRGWSVPVVATRAGVSVNAVRRAEDDGARAATVEALFAVLASKVRVRKPERAQWQNGKRDCRWTPPEVFDPIERACGPFDLDPSGDPDSPVRAELVFTETDDGLSRDWSGRVFCNPPHSGAARFVRKAHDMWTGGQCPVVALLLPVQTHLAAFHDLIAGVADIFLLRDRIRFIAPDGKRDKAPFPSMIVVYGADDRAVSRLLENFACVHIARSATKGRRPAVAKG